MRRRGTGTRRRMAIAMASISAAVVSLGCATGEGSSRDPDAAPSRSDRTPAPAERSTNARVASQTPLEPVASRDRGLAWLIANQNGDGSWGSFESARPGEIYLGTVASHRAFRDATSALATMALMPAAARGDRAALASLERAVAYLVATPPSLRATGDTFYNVWTHTYMVQAAARLLESSLVPARRGQLQALLARELDLLRRTQAADGGWGYYDFDHGAATPSGDQTTSFNTASVLLALRDAAAVGVSFEPSRIGDAIAVLERLRLPSGAYAYGTYAQFRPAANFNMVPGSIGRSQPCNLALHRAGRLSSGLLLEGLEALRRDHRYLQIGQGRPRPHEAYYQTSGYYYFYGHYYAAEGIALLDDPERHDLNDWMLGVIAGVQNPDGSWLDFPMYGYGKPYGTAYALMTLERCLETASERSTGSEDADDSR